MLGLRLVKNTVNFDDPGTYHLYYGDERGRPGTVMTFFPWGQAPGAADRGGPAVVASFSIPAATPGTGWRAWRIGVRFEKPCDRFAEALTFGDPDGLRLELVAPKTREPNSPGVPFQRSNRSGAFSTSPWPTRASKARRA